MQSQLLFAHLLSSFQTPLLSFPVTLGYMESGPLRRVQYSTPTLSNHCGQGRYYFFGGEIDINTALKGVLLKSCVPYNCDESM